MVLVIFVPAAQLLLLGIRWFRKVWGKGSRSAMLSKKSLMELDNLEGEQEALSGLNAEVENVETDGNLGRLMNYR